MTKNILFSLCALLLLYVDLQTSQYGRAVFQWWFLPPSVHKVVFASTEQNLCGWSLDLKQV